MNPQPPAGDIAWGGHKPGDGVIYIRTCPDAAGNTQTDVWSQTPPPGYGGGVSAAQLAQQAMAKMLLSGPAIGIAPKPSGTGLVGLPVWMWDVTSKTTWGPTSATAAAGGTSVTATAQVSSIVWSMGDGSQVTCDGAGTAYQSSYGDEQSPTCGYLYQQSSAKQPGGKYTVTATSSWTVAWTANNGQTGTLTTTRTSTTAIPIGELQVLNH